MKISEKWLREWVNPALSIKALCDQLTMAGLEVDSIETKDNDNIIEIDLTPNRGDCLSIMGIAREIAALNNLKTTAIQIESIEPQIQESLQLELKAADKCPCYLGRVIRNTHLNPTPEWMLQRLEQSDIRAVHPVVDVLNYVMLELGQPMHAFDLDKLKAPVVIRTAIAGETIKLLNEQEVILKEDTLVIADSQQVLAIAGIMGGIESGVGENTKHIFLESALFSAKLLAGKARLYGLHTDSSFRFERGVDPQLQRRALERATSLILEICGGEPGPVIQVMDAKAMPIQAEIVLRFDRVRQILGLEIEDFAIRNHLLAIDCELSEYVENDMLALLVKPKPYRSDLANEIDLIEEIARLIGYNNIPNHMPVMSTQFIPDSETNVSVARIKRAFVDMGYQELITYSFVDGALQQQLFPELAGLSLMNPISADMDQMRLSLWPGLLNALQYNQNRQQQRFKCFEVGLCFLPQADGTLKQINKVGGLLAGDFAHPSWDVAKRSVDFFDMKQHIEAVWQLLGFKQNLTFQRSDESRCYPFHPGQSALLMWQAKEVGSLGRLHPSLCKALEIDGAVYLFEMDIALLAHCQVPVFQRPSRYPEIHRDIAVIVDQHVLSDSLINFVRESAVEIVRDVRIFDVYTGKGIDSGRKSIAMGLILQHPSRTLVDKEVEDLIHSIVLGLKTEFGAELRE
ncbi:MAG: phenylalanine--tRNA ligase subunit beta [Proteobacteria bacterium]|nr:phenylalanine--tRNA ligase subunit beta [Pseudomonadota bacterium]